MIPNNRNEDIKQAKREIPFWQIAERIGVSENTLLRWMRSDLFLEPERRRKIMNAIDEIRKEVIHDDNSV